MHKPEVTGFFDEATYTISYVVADPETKHCAIVDSLLDYDQASGRTTTTSADKLINFVRQNGLTCEWIIDTHVHADHLTAAPYIREQLGGKTAIGDKIPVVQRVFGEIFNEGQSFHTDGSQFDHLFKPGESYRVGNIEARALATPGHTPACMTHLIGDAMFVGDTIFMSDFGTAVATSRAATPEHSTTRSRCCSTFRTRPACSSATTTKRLAVMNMSGRLQSVNRSAPTFM